MIYTCPFCQKMFEMGSDHGVEPCADCYSAGHRIDSCGNRSYQDAITGANQKATAKLIAGLRRTQ